MTTPKIFPIYLPHQVAVNLVNQHAWQEFDKESSLMPRSTEYSYSAYLAENGTVELSVRYGYTGYVSGSGNLFKKTIPACFGTDQVEHYKRRRIRELAQQEYDRRQEAARIEAIKEIEWEMFGNTEHDTQPETNSTIDSWVHGVF